MLNDIDYKKYLSYDNGRGLLFSNDDVIILKRYGFDCDNYDNLSSLIFDVDSYLNGSCLDDCEDLENVLIRLSDLDYYNNFNK